MKKGTYVFYLNPEGCAFMTQTSSETVDIPCFPGMYAVLLEGVIGYVPMSRVFRVEVYESVLKEYVDTLKQHKLIAEIVELLKGLQWEDYPSPRYLMTGQVFNKLLQLCTKLKESHV